MVVFTVNTLGQKLSCLIFLQYIAPPSAIIYCGRLACSANSLSILGDSQIYYYIMQKSSEGNSNKECIRDFLFMQPPDILA